ncbi:MAG: hypothetical protein ACRDL7_12655, partial [Gaiellaceae bacterium]
MEPFILINASSVGHRHLFKAKTSLERNPTIGKFIWHQYHSVRPNLPGPPPTRSPHRISGRSNAKKPPKSLPICHRTDSILIDKAISDINQHKALTITKAKLWLTSSPTKSVEIAYEIAAFRLHYQQHNALAHRLHLIIKRLRDHRLRANHQSYISDNYNTTF